MALSLLFTALAVGSNIADSLGNNKDIDATVAQAKEQYQLKTDIKKQQMVGIERQLSTILRETDFAMLKAESTVSAGAGESGVKGTSVEQVKGAVASSFGQDKARTELKAESQKVDLVRGMLMDRADYEATVNTLQSQKVSTAEMLLGATASGISAYASSYEASPTDIPSLDAPDYIDYNVNDLLND